MESVTRFFKGPEGSFFLFGPRGTGKSTFVRGAYAGALTVDLLEPDTHRRLQTAPERLKELVEGVLCLPCEEFLRALHPARLLDEGM